MPQPPSRPTSTTLAVGVAAARGIAVALLVMLLAVAGGFERLNQAGYDGLVRRLDRHQASRPSATPTHVLVGQVAPEQVEQWERGAPAARTQLAHLIGRLAGLAPAALVIDAVMDRPAADDAALAAACRQAGGVVLRCGVISPRPREYVGAELPPVLAAAADRGFALWPPESDGTVRRFVLALPQGSYLALPTAAWAVAKKQREADVLNAIEHGRGPLRLPLRQAEHEGALLAFLGPPGAGPPIVPVDSLTREAVRGSIVVVGAIDSSRGGVVTPLAVSERAGWLERRPVYMSQTELLANATATLLDSTWGRDLGWAATLILLIAAGLAGTGCAAVRRVPLGLVSWAVAAGGGSSLVWVTYSQARWVLPEPPLQVALGAAALLGWIRRLAGHLEEARAQARAAESERERLRDLDEAKRAVLSVVCHDLRNPLTIIKGQALTLASDPGRELGSRIHEEFLGSISFQCDRLQIMVEDLLDTDPDRPPNLLVEPVDVPELVEQVVAMYRPNSRRHTIEVQAPPLPPLLLDRDRLTRVLHNLLSNAVKYSPKGGIVRVRVARDEAADELLLAVRDDGVGMRPDQVARLFGLFVRVIDDPAAIPGTGVGLYSVKRLVEAHGGRIEVESAPGQGSEFRCHLPWRTIEVGPGVP